jgi:hypothetical protein
MPVRKTQQGPVQTEFLSLLRHSMIDRNINTPGQLYRLVKDKGPGGWSPSRATVYNYFTGQNTPQPWFFLAVCEVFEEMGEPLTREEVSELMWAYFKSY